MKLDHHSLEYKKMAKPNKKYKELKSRQKNRIAQWIYEGFYEFYKVNGRMPDDAERLQVIRIVYKKLEQLALWVPFEEVCKWFSKKIPGYEQRIMKDMAIEADKKEMNALPNRKEHVIRNWKKA